MMTVHLAARRPKPRVKEDIRRLAIRPNTRRHFKKEEKVREILVLALFDQNCVFFFQKESTRL